MSKVNNKGFMLAEIVVVATVIMVILVSLFTTVNRLLIQYNKRKGYDTVDAIYAAEALSKNYDFYADEYNFEKEGSDDYKQLTIEANNEHSIKSAYIIKNSKESFEKFLLGKDKTDNFVAYINYLSNNLEFGGSYSIDAYSKILVLEIENNNTEFGYYYIKKMDTRQEANYDGDRYDVLYPPNPPDLSVGLTPVKYNGSKWIVTSKYDEDWYDYDNQKWANAVALRPSITKNVGDDLNLENDIYAMFVWIPRFSYTIGCQDSCQNTVCYPNNRCCTSKSCLGYEIEGASSLNVPSSEDYSKVATPGAIDIRFVKKNVRDIISDIARPAYEYDASSTEKERKKNINNWMTHPAFWWDKDDDGNWDEDENLSGIWVAKFDVGVLQKYDSSCYTSPSPSNCLSSALTSPVILPDAVAVSYQNIYEKHLTAKKIQTYLKKGDVHLMKNSEWGVVSYLSQSKYGKYGNTNYTGDYKVVYPNNSNDNTSKKIVKTGRSSGTPYNLRDCNPAKETCSINGVNYLSYVVCLDCNTDGNYRYYYEKHGTGASTTGNIYGVYDMVGNDEAVMANVNNVCKLGCNSGSNPINTFGKRYVDIYNEEPSVYSSKTLGHAASEVGSAFELPLYGWSYQLTFFSENKPWYVRGKRGIYYYLDYDGGSSNVYYHVALINNG